MQRLTIRERMLVVALLPLVLFMLAQAFGGFWPWLDVTVAALGAFGLYFGAVAFAVVLAFVTARSLARPLEDAGVTLDAIVRAELDCEPRAPDVRCSEIVLHDDAGIARNMATEIAG